MFSLGENQYDCNVIVLLWIHDFVIKIVNLRFVQECFSHYFFVVIFLDSLDQLTNENEGRDLHWLCPVLPKHVHLIVTIRPNAGGALSAMRNLVQVRISFHLRLPSVSLWSKKLVNLLLIGWYIFPCGDHCLVPEKHSKTHYEMGHWIGCTSLLLEFGHTLMFIDLFIDL